MKRLAVLFPGIVVAYFSARTIFPYVDRRLPAGIAVLITYILGAYVLVPAVMRLWRVAVRPAHPPLYCITPDGYASDPLNIDIIGSRAQLIAAMEAAGWHVAQPYNARNALHGLIAIILKQPYHGAPISALYLFGRRQDIGFEMQLAEKGRGHRHHVRFWATAADGKQFPGMPDTHATSTDSGDGRPLSWLGAASRDIGITFAKQSWQLTHAVLADTDSERELIVRQLTRLGLASVVTTIRLHKSYRLVNFAWSRSLRTDGTMAVLQLQ